jgi:hypothetical protein
MGSDVNISQIRPADQAKFTRSRDVLDRTFYRQWYIEERNPYAKEWLETNDKDWFEGHKEDRRIVQG